MFLSVATQIKLSFGGHHLVAVLTVQCSWIWCRCGSGGGVQWRQEVRRAGVASSLHHSEHWLNMSFKKYKGDNLETSNYWAMIKMTGETPKVRSDIRKPKMLLRDDKYRVHQKRSLRDFHLKSVQEVWFYFFTGVSEFWAHFIWALEWYPSKSEMS